VKAVVQKGGALERLVAPWPLLLGVLASFLGCCAAGRWYGHHNVYQDFQRFHPWINQQTHHYPTATQVMALARTRLDPDKVAVIVGSNSILYGAGQRAAVLWTKALQAELGDDYRVINLAVGGAFPVEFGGVVAEALSGEYRKMVFVTLTGGATGGPPDGHFYQYLYWDAWGKGLLGEYPEREEGLREYARAARRDPAKMEELARRARANGYLYFNDLWNALAYTRLSTAWHVAAGTHTLRPRKRYADPGPEPPPLAQRYPPGHGAEEVARLHFWARHGADMIRGYALLPGQPDVLDPSRSPMCRQMWAAFPEPFRARTLVLIPHDNPHYVRQLTPAEQETCRDLVVRQVRILEMAGFPALGVGRDFDEENFVDQCHPSETGGLRLAAEVAPKVRELARKLGYLGEGGRP
jgi:hypothetical protein